MRKLILLATTFIFIFQSFAMDNSIVKVGLSAAGVGALVYGGISLKKRCDAFNNQIKLNKGLIAAAYKNEDISVLQKWLDDGADVNYVDQVEICPLVTIFGICLVGKGCRSETALTGAVFSTVVGEKGQDPIDFLLERGANPDLGGAFYLAGYVRPHCQVLAKLLRYSKKREQQLAKVLSWSVHEKKKEIVKFATDSFKKKSNLISQIKSRAGGCNNLLDEAYLSRQQEIVDLLAPHFSTQEIEAAKQKAQKRPWGVTSWKEAEPLIV